MTSVDNGGDALAALADGTFDLVLMDRHMPVMDGVEATRRIRALKTPTAAIPIVGITAGATQTELDACIASGMNMCLTKPVKPRTLIETVERYGAGDGAGASAEASGGPSDGAASKGDGRRYLFVDDTQINRDVARKQFAKLGLDCDVAASGAEALQLAGVHAYDGVFIDITMPDMDGMELARRLRALETDGDGRVPIFAVTGHASPEDREKFLAAGMDDVIVKPVTVESLSALVSGGAAER